MVFRRRLVGVRRRRRRLWGRLFLQGCLPGGLHRLVVVYSASSSGIVARAIVLLRWVAQDVECGGLKYGWVVVRRDEPGIVCAALVTITLARFELQGRSCGCG